MVRAVANSVSSTPNLRKELQSLFDDWLKKPFPHGSKDSRIHGLHDMLILYDADVAEAVRKLLSAPKRPNWFARLRLRFALSEYGRLEKRIQKLSLEPLNQVAQAVESYREYYEAMKKVIRAARAYLSTTNNKQ